MQSGIVVSIRLHANADEMGVPVDLHLRILGASRSGGRNSGEIYSARRKDCNEPRCRADATQAEGGSAAHRRMICSFDPSL